MFFLFFCFFLKDISPARPFLKSFSYLQKKGKLTLFISQVCLLVLLHVPQWKQLWFFTITMFSFISHLCYMTHCYTLIFGQTELNLNLCVRRPPFLLFSGGMPRASYGDRHCITVIHSKTHVALDFTSRIIDFFVIKDGPQNTGRQRAPDAADIWQTHTVHSFEKTLFNKAFSQQSQVQTALTQNFNWNEK